jgi:hypothetical protein
MRTELEIIVVEKSLPQLNRLDQTELTRMHIVAMPKLGPPHHGQVRKYCKGKLPLSVLLVINDNPYVLMFSLSFL